MSDSKTLLVVDDEPEVREIIELYTAELGYSVLEACDGEQAIEVLKNNDVDLVISDLMMPRMSGLTFLETIRSEGYTLPFIFVTAYPSRDSTVQALRLGAFDYIEKPFEREQLHDLIKEAMRVSEEQKKLNPASMDSAEEEVETSSEDQATLEIMKMRTLRYDTTREPPKSDEENQTKLEELFIAEAEPQLLFSEGAIKGLKDPDNRAWELGYLFRVMQAISQAAKVISAEKVIELSTALERCYTALRVRPDAVTDSVIGILESANDELRELVSHVGGESQLAVAGTISQLDAITTSIEAENHKDAI